MPTHIKMTVICALLNDIKRSEHFELAARSDNNSASALFWHQEAKAAKEALKWIREH